MRLIFALLLSCLYSSAAHAQGDSCPFKAAELTAVFGMPFTDGVGSASPFAGGKLLSCSYKAPKGFAIETAQVVAASKSDAQQIAKGVQGTALAGDPDSASWATVLGDSHRLTLSYVRATTHTQISFVGANSKKPTEADPIKSKLLKLRRVP